MVITVILDLSVLTNTHRAGKGLERLETSVLADGFQVSDSNPMLGVDSRAALLRSLGQSLLAHPDVFGAEGRPGRLVGTAVPFAMNSQIAC